MLVLRLLYGSACLVIATVTLAGMLAPLVPSIDLVNHFRPHLVIASVAVVAVGWLLPGRRHPWLGLSVLGLNVLLATPAFINGMHPRLLVSIGGEEAKVVSFNLWRSERHEDIASYLAKENGNIVVLQELQGFHIRELLPRLKASYPHQTICGDCMIGVLSKDPLAAVEFDRAGRWVTGLWTPRRGRAVRIVGVHLSWPFQPPEQARDINDLARAAQAWREPLIVAGDFNLTPWSWKLNKLRLATGLTHHGTLAASWPVARQLPALGPLRHWPLPAMVLIDNVLTSPEMSSLGFTAGPDLGSDHRPVVARMTLP